MIKKKIGCLWVVLACFSLIGCSHGVDDPDIDISVPEIIFHNVTAPKYQNGYVFVGEKKVRHGDDYSFSLSIAEGYAYDELKVTANGSLLLSDSLSYCVKNVNEDLAIEVSGIIAEPFLKISKGSYRFYLGRISEEKKKEGYFLEGAEGFYDGKECAVTVDLSNVDFDTAGAYDIVYSLIGHAEIRKRAKVAILPDPENIDDVEIDVATVFEREVVPQKIYGDIHLDFALSYGERVLTQEDAFASEKYGGNFLSKKYLKSLGLGKHPFKAIFDEDVYVEFNVTIVDKKGANFSYQVEEEELCFVEGSLSLPDIVLAEDSIQEIEATYSLEDVAMSKEEIVSRIGYEKGDYSYAINVSYGGAVVSNKTYKLHIREEYIPFSFASTGSKNASKNYSSRGNVVLNFNSTDDTNVFLDSNYIISNNQENKKYVFVAFRILSNGGSNASMWNRDPEVCFDKDGNYVPVSANPKYNGGNIGAAGSLMYGIFALNGTSFENDVWIMRNFNGSIEIIKTVFCDLDYVDPVIDIETTKNKLANFPSSFDTIWNYIHVAAHGSSGGTALAGNCIDLQSSLFTDMQKVGYEGIKIKLSIQDRDDIQKVECWVYGGAHLASYDAIAEEKTFAIDFPLSAYEKRGSTGNIMFYFNTSLTSASTYGEMRSNPNGTYVSSANFFITEVSYY